MIDYVRMDIALFVIFSALFLSLSIICQWHHTRLRRIERNLCERHRKTP